MNEGKNRRIYILLTDTGTIFTRIIRLYTKAPYNHVCIGFDESLEHLYSFGRKKPRNPFIGGFVKENINNGVYAVFKDTNCALYYFDVDECTFKRIKENIGIFEAQREKYKYNLIGLLGVICGKPVNRKYAYFCSQFVATVLSKSGIDFFGKHPSLVIPYDFARIKHLNLMYRGKLRDYAAYRYNAEGA